MPGATAARSISRFGEQPSITKRDTIVEAVLVSGVGASVYSALKGQFLVAPALIP